MAGSGTGRSWHYWGFNPVTGALQLKTPLCGVLHNGQIVLLRFFAINLIGIDKREDSHNQDRQDNKIKSQAGKKQAAQRQDAGGFK